MAPTTDPAKMKREKLRALLARPQLSVMPGGFSPVYARIAEMAGFECFFIAGSQMSAYLLGVPDTGIIGFRDVIDHARHVTARTDIPIFLDLDTGFGNAVNVHFSVQECVRAGIAGVSLEDQEAPKKSATVAGRRCIPRDEAVGKIRAAVAARNEIDPDFVICARCDVLGAEGGTFEEALERSIAYVREGGADFVWLNSVETREQAARACAEIPAPVMVIWGGEQPAPTLEEYSRVGVRIALYPVIASSVGLQAAWMTLNDFRERGTVALDEWAARVRESRWGPLSLASIVRFDQVREIEERCLPPSEQRDYDSTWGHRTLV
jgi:2-methylisocitrate lyase-like PEP mutase family enzyme